MKRCGLEGCGKLVYIEPESGRAHDYCCRTHAQQRTRHSRGQSSQGQYHAQPIESSHCSFLGCSRPRFRDPVTGALKDFCGRTHAARAKEAADGIAGAEQGSNIFSDRGMDEQRRSRTEEIDLTDSSLPNAASQGYTSTLLPTDAHRSASSGASFPKVNLDVF
jgi:hypothetical protein